MKSFALIALCGSMVASLLAWAMPLLTSKPDRFQLALQLLDQDKPDKAVHLFEIPEWRGVAQYKAQRYRRALGEFLERETVVNLYNLGNAYAKLKEWAGAKAAFERALRLDPAHEDAKFNLELVLRAEALELAMLEESRESTQLGNWKDGNSEQLAAEDTNSNIVEEGIPEGGAFRPAAEDAEASGKSDREGRNGEIAKFENAQAGIASGSPVDPQSDGELTGSGASLLLRQSRQNVDILLGRITDDPERVLRARLVAAFKNRSLAQAEGVAR